MAWTLCISEAAITKAGADANADIVISGATLERWSNEAEGAVIAITRKDWVADYANVKANFKPILADTVSDIIASKIINYDLNSYPLLLGATTMLDVLKDNINRNLNELKKEAIQENM